jgi:putative transposase
MYRILAQEDEIRNRRNQLRHLSSPKPELLVTQPNQLWSWDIIKLAGLNKWTNFYLYVILDDFSRCVVSWRVARRESGSLIGQLIQETCRKQKIVKNQLTLRSDRDSSTTCKSVKLLLSKLGVPQIHSYPDAPNNQVSKARFKTLKNQPIFPTHFGCVEDAQAFCQKFFAWYNREYYHCENSLLTPEVVHYGLDKRIIKQQQQLVLSSAYRAHPERFVHRPPQPAGRTHINCNPRSDLQSWN